LADVPVSTVISGTITDRRINFLKVATEVLGNNIVRTDNPFTQALTAGLSVPTLTVTGSNGAFVTLSSGIGGTNVTLSLTQLQTLLTQTHTQNTDVGTTSPTFTVGIGGTQQLVMLEPDSPMPPKNFRVVDVYSPTLGVIDPDMAANLAASVSTGLVSHEASVSLAWNYRKIIGNGGYGTSGVVATGKFRITNSGGELVWTENELVGYHVYLSHQALDYKITANLATTGTETVLTVVPYKHNTIIDGLNSATRPGYDAFIHSNCDSYEIVAIPEDASGALFANERYEFEVKYLDGVASLQKVIDLFLGERVSIAIRAKLGSFYSDYVELMPGMYSKNPPYNTAQYYTRPFSVQMPSIDSTGAKVGANTSAAGFTVTIVGWELATDFEICYTTDAAGADFQNPTHAKAPLTRDRSVDISTSSPGQYQIAVRPLMSGQAVAPAKTCTVKSGAGGYKTTDKVLSISNITFKTYSGTISTYSNGVYAWGLATCYTPAGNGASATTLDDSVIGSYITIDSVDYVITDRIGANINIATLGGVDINSGFNSKTYQINTSKASRVFSDSTVFQSDVQITEVDIAQWSTPGRRSDHVPVVRWYQRGREEYADSLPLVSPGSVNYSQATDVTILSQYGDRTLIVDFWDPTLDDNLSGFVGSINIFYREYVSTGRKTDTTIAPPITTIVS
jgi:hypothetical protein